MKTICLVCFWMTPTPTIIGRSGPFLWLSLWDHSGLLEMRFDSPWWKLCISLRLVHMEPLTVWSSQARLSCSVSRAGSCCTDFIAAGLFVFLIQRDQFLCDNSNSLITNLNDCHRERVYKAFMLKSVRGKEWTLGWGYPSLCFSLLQNTEIHIQSWNFQMPEILVCCPVPTSLSSISQLVPQHLFMKSKYLGWWRITWHKEAMGYVRYA